MDAARGSSCKATTPAPHGSGRVVCKVVAKSLRGQQNRFFFFAFLFYLFIYLFIFLTLLLLFDLLSNGGGLLLQAINILDFLLEKDLDNPILVRKGRNSERKYFSSNEPIINDSIPIVILQNSRSASASEIVSGVLQDLDRAIVMGQNSFGKGLVQITKTINDRIKLKLTTAK